MMLRNERTNIEFDAEINFSRKIKGHNQWVIYCNVEIYGNKTTFAQYTSDTKFMELISDMHQDERSGEDIQCEYEQMFLDGFLPSIYDFETELNQLIF